MWKIPLSRIFGADDDDENVAMGGVGSVIFHQIFLSFFSSFSSFFFLFRLSLFEKNKKKNSTQKRAAWTRRDEIEIKN